MTLTRFDFTTRARPILEVGIGSSVYDDAAALWDVSLWDAPTSKWNGDQPLWRDVGCDVIDAHIELGRGRITDAFPVGTAEITVDNGSGWADPSLDFEDDTTVGHLSFPGTAGNYISVDDYPALGITGDCCFVFRFRTEQWPPPAWTGYIARKDGAWVLALTADGTGGRLQLWTVNGVTTNIHTSALIAPSTDWRWYAVAFDANNGAGGHESQWYYGGNDQDAPGTWVDAGGGTGAGVLAINDNANPLHLGTSVADGFVGDVSHLSVRSGFGAGVTVGGTAVFEFNGWNLTVADETATSIMPSVGSNPMVLNGDVDVVAAVQPDVGRLKLRPGRGIRIGVAHSSFGEKWLYRGFIDAIEPVDDPEDWSTVRLRCIDALGEAGRAKLADAEESGAGETARTRFIRILNQIRWPSTLRSISPSAIRPLLAAELDGQVIDLLRQTAESEGGWAFADTEGRIVLQHKDWLYHVVGSAVDATIGNVDVGGTGLLELLIENGLDLLIEQLDELLLESEEDERDVCPGKWVRAFDRRDMATRVILDRDVPSDYGSDPAAVVVNDIRAQTLYGIEPFERLDLWTERTGDLQQIAGKIMSTRSAAVSLPRIRSVTLDATAGDDTVDLLSQLSIFTPSRYRCRLLKDGRIVFDSKYFAVGVTHDLTAEGWTADVSLDRSLPFEVLDPVDYIWDTARWDRSLWN